MWIRDLVLGMDGEAGQVRADRLAVSPWRWHLAQWLLKTTLPVARVAGLARRAPAAVEHLLAVGARAARRPGQELPGPGAAIALSG